ncbi:hypothetical protein S7711_02672 [Stachybotrys chartarum IBT 7711]|uniref:Uncharacterized protein n=1 Tax=Stachybotrys chartarum (strain CBS 109288 / IBT 7711) TaxID=1280523 RepID=A0A084AYX2_STACB|nr:hypothetical protein S7711_02672 [Stachybotrys chartarum IBT 7711]KFA79771.1 hypothetical protein S40288_00730 [Stachybotrys chartarum IBT 40288]
MAKISLFLLALLGASNAVAAPTGNGTSSNVRVRWLGDTPNSTIGATFGLPWPKGRYRPNDTEFSLFGADAEPIPFATWVTGYWRDGSVKWTGHAISQADSVPEEYTVRASPCRASRKRAVDGLSVDDSSDEVTVSTGRITVTFPKSGSSIVGSIVTSGGKTVGRDGKLVLHSQSSIPDDVASRADGSVDYHNFESVIEEVTVSDESSVRALVTVRGQHQLSSGADHDDWLQFVLRFYLYQDSDAIRIIHTIVFDGDNSRDFISGLGIRFQVPLEGEELYNRHVRIAGADGGFLNEAVLGITGLRRDPGAAVRTAQHEGRELPDESTWDVRVTSRLHWIPVWNDYRLSQLSSDGFTLKKRTEPGQSWLNIPGGTRSGGLAYLGGATQGGLAVGGRDFWKRYPTGLDISGAGSDEGSITLWLYSPEAAPLDLRGYHDGMGQDTYEEQLDALEITYEDYEPGFDTPFGIARTNEIYLFAFENTPTSDRLAELNEYVNAPPVLQAEPEYIKDTQAAGDYWDLPDTSTPRRANIESNLDFNIRHYIAEVEARRWYGFLDYGDFMHAYDPDRHQWRYDIGGYAWDNSELSPDLFVWQYFLRTGREDVWRFAEALTRHTGEVDTYHIGDWKGLGTRHGVLHFADSAKQARIAQPQYRKYFYYLSGGDERTGEIIAETLDADQTYGILDPVRKVRTDGWTPSPENPVSFGLGTDWGGLAASWLIEWERRGPRWEEARDKLLGTATSIANLRYGFVTGSGLYYIENATLTPPPGDPNNEGIVSVSHLSSVFGLPEVIWEFLDFVGDEAPEGFEDAWLEYSYYYLATPAEQTERYGSRFTVSLRQAHSRLLARWAAVNGNETAARAAWTTYFSDGLRETSPWATERISGSGLLAPVDEAAWLSTNDFAQYGLASIQNLALIADSLEG